MHLNAIPARSRYKFDLARLSHIEEKLPNKFINALLTHQVLKFRISWKENVPDLNSLFEEGQAKLVKITKSFENLINQTDAIEAEKGINTFGFGFPLLVRRDESDNKLTVAPILIWSLKIKRTKEFNTWEIIRTEEDPIYVNELLINHLQNDSKVEIEQLTSDHLEDGLINKDELLNICVGILKSINNSAPGDLRQTLEKKFSNIKPIPDKKYYEKLSLTSNNAFIDFAGLFSIFEVQKQNIIQDYQNLLNLQDATIDLDDMREHGFQPISSVETDPSQQGILHALKSSRNILIQGPPGTGKSQSLTAILVNALENRKKTIVVCEKRTALEVLQKALNERGLNYQCVLLKDSVKDRKLAVNSVRDRVDNASYKRYNHSRSKEGLDLIIDKAKSLIDTINKGHKKIDEKLLGNKNWTQVVGLLLAELKTNTEDFKLDITKGAFAYNAPELDGLLETLRVGHNLFVEYKPNEKFSFLNPKKLIGDNPFIVEQQIKEDFNYYKKEYKSLLLLKLEYEMEYIAIRRQQLKKQLTSIRGLIKDIESIFEKNKGNTDFYDEEKTNTSLYKTFAIFSSEKKATREDQQELAVLFNKLKSTIKEYSRDFEAISLSPDIKEREDFLQTYHEVLAKTESAFPAKVDQEFKELDLLQPLDPPFQTKNLQLLKDRYLRLKNKIVLDAWTKKELENLSYKDLLEAIKEIIDVKDRFFSHENDLFSVEFKWFQFYNSLSETNRVIIDQLKEKENWKKVFLIFYLDSMLINSANTDLPTNENEHVELSKSLSKLEKEQIKYIREYWFSQQKDASKEFDRKYPNLAIENLYNKRASRKHKRLSLRQIVKFDLDLFTTFFPIILTTPDVCSNLFHGENKYFDIVMFDEASQLKLEDNLPALLKGKQIVIAGDEHQMPPSNYFSKIFDGSIEDEDDFEDELDKIENQLTSSLTDCESLLDFATVLGFEKKYLDFHYRSRHPYLIEFSNHAFYKGRFKPLPNNLDYIPIKYVHVNGTYIENSNHAEAETILSIIENNISRFPNGEYPTVGIATFNIQQRNLILNKINERRKFEKYQEFNEKIAEMETRGFFVKNLENIQGDERDVILLSTTYGVNPENKFAQRFGSINHQKGYKLLNVIITRAKYKVYVCSSIPEEVFLNYREHLITEGSNNRRAAFYAYLAYSKAVSEEDNEARLAVLNSLAENSGEYFPSNSFNEMMESPFEQEVYQALLDNFKERKIIPQLQFAGFRIDIVYEPTKTGLPKIAIECDGAAHHSSEEAYLYDRHRQKILEKHGFVFHRIWSTNWWRNPEMEIKKLVGFIKKIEKSDASIFEGTSATSRAFSNDVADVEMVFAESFPHFQKNLETIDAATKKEKEKTVKELVKLNSRVKLKYLNNGEDIAVHLIDQAISNVREHDGVRKIRMKSALGESLIGKSVGETVKVGHLDNYVQILEILN